MNIQYITIPGGGLDFFLFYGILQYLNKENVYHIDNIKNIYGTSCGSILAILLILKLEWDVLDKYIIHRPWEKLFDITPDTLFNCISNKGLFTIDIFYSLFTPLFKAQNYDINITFKELYEKTGIHLNIFAVEYNTTTLVNFNKDTYPNLGIIKASYMSSTLIPIFQPVLHEDKYYIDGGVILNNPITYLAETIDDDIEDKAIGILDISYCKTNKITNFKIEDIDKDCNLLQFVFSLVLRLSNKIHDSSFTNLDRINKVKHIVNISSSIDQYKLSSWVDCLEKAECRVLLIKKGIEYAELFLNYRNKSVSK